ncbi:hypothetical protein D3C85_1365150 [compost metagenome]
MPRDHQHFVASVAIHVHPPQETTLAAALAQGHDHRGELLAARLLRPQPFKVRGVTVVGVQRVGFIHDPLQLFPSFGVEQFVSLEPRFQRLERLTSRLAQAVVQSSGIEFLDRGTPAKQTLDLVVCTELQRVQQRRIEQHHEHRAEQGNPRVADPQAVQPALARGEHCPECGQAVNLHHTDQQQGEDALRRKAILIYPQPA